MRTTMKEVAGTLTGFGILLLVCGGLYFVNCEGMSDWARLGDLEDRVAALEAAP